jgi:transglutaminase-like putative cysteine protease
MRFRIKHTTRYVYEQPASHSHNDMRLTPIDAPDQKRVAFRLDVTPAAEIAEYLDAFGNLTHSIDLQPPHTFTPAPAAPTHMAYELEVGLASQDSIDELSE